MDRRAHGELRLSLPEPMPTWPTGALREWRPGDGERLVAAWTDPLIARWNPVPSDPSLERAEAWIAGVKPRMASARALDLCIVSTASTHDAPTIVGEVGLSGIDDAARGALVGYWLLPEARGLGLATAALEAMVHHAFELGFAVLAARCAADNHPSQRVAARCGFIHTRDAERGEQLWFRRRPTANDPTHSR